jgi:hypothetical protein
MEQITVNNFTNISRIFLSAILKLWIKLGLIFLLVMLEFNLSLSERG